MSRQKQHIGRSNGRTYTQEQLQELVMTAEQAAKQGTQRMLEREKAYKSMKKSGGNEQKRP